MSRWVTGYGLRALILGGIKGAAKVSTFVGNSRKHSSGNISIL